MYYHASQTKNIKELIPHVSNHKESLIYFSKKRENVLVYLSNAIEKFCKENNFEWNGIWNKWASYSFDKDGILVIEEYYPNALVETYKGVSGYIYYIDKVDNLKKQSDIPFAYTSSSNVKVSGFEYIEDAYHEIIDAINNGFIKFNSYEDVIKTKKEWLYEIIKKEYLDPELTSDYKFFLENKFSDIILQCKNK